MTIYENAKTTLPQYRPFYFGEELALNLYGCDPNVIKSDAALRTYAREAVHLLDMKAYGEPVLSHFGHDSPITSGYTLVQLIETSSITGHFSEGSWSAFINIFSCKPYDAKKAREHASEFFDAQYCTYWKLDR